MEEEKILQETVRGGRAAPVLKGGTHGSQRPPTKGMTRREEYTSKRECGLTARFRRKTRFQTSYSWG